MATHTAARLPTAILSLSRFPRYGGSGVGRMSDLDLRAGDLDHALVTSNPFPRWRYYPAWRRPPEWVFELSAAVAAIEESVGSQLAHFASNQVLLRMKPTLETLGYQVEGSQKLPRPVLFGDQGSVLKSFSVDAFHAGLGIALEVESGGAMYNHRVLLDLMKMCVAVDVQFGVIAVPLEYKTKAKTWTPPYKEALKLFDSIYANPERLRIPLDGMLLLGY
jgi:hypothetical protein